MSLRTLSILPIGQTIFSWLVEYWPVIVACGLVLTVGVVLLFLRFAKRSELEKDTLALQAQTMSASCIEAIGLENGPQCFPLNPHGFVIGRAPDSDLVITEAFPAWETVSRHHARIYWQADQWVIRDLGSANGAYVNGKRTGHNLLRDGWQISIGGAPFVFHQGVPEMPQCPDCGYENRPGARFCRQCGATLATPTVRLDASLEQTEPLDVSAQKPEFSVSTLPVTRPLPGAGVDFGVLSEGALLSDGRYVVEQVRSSNNGSHTYLVQDTTPIRVCPICQTSAIDGAEPFCTICGADLARGDLAYPHYLVNESASEHSFAVESQLLSMHLDHSGLLLPHAIFVEAPYGPARHYLVEPERSSFMAATLAVPQKLEQVLKWGISLASALDHLHQHQVTLCQVDLNHIAIEGDRACWAHLGIARILSPEGPVIETDCFVQDVRELAEVLFYLATGQQQYIADVTLPEPAAQLFEKVIAGREPVSAAAFRDELENVLGKGHRSVQDSYDVGRRTDVGRQRSVNQDSILTLGTDLAFQASKEPAGLYVVADGMGGHAAGDVASQMVIQMIAQRAMRGAPPGSGDHLSFSEVGQWLKTAIVAANQAVYEQRLSQGTDMGTTLVAAFVVGNMAMIANVGDSRAYRLTPETIEQITIDHSLVQHLVSVGQITQEEAANHRQKNVIYRAIGDKPEVEIDLFEQRLAPGEALLLCSDGLSGMVSDERIWQIWSVSSSPQETCDRLVEAANQAGGEDNISVVIVSAIRGSAIF